MINKTGISALFITLIMSLGTQQIYAQKEQKEMKLMKVNYEVEVNVSPEKAWEVLASLWQCRRLSFWGEIIRIYQRKWQYCRNGM